VDHSRHALPAGLIVAANSYNYAETQYFRDRCATIANGLVKVKYQDRGLVHRRASAVKTFSAPEVEQPNLTKNNSRPYEPTRRSSPVDCQFRGTGDADPSLPRRASSKSPRSASRFRRAQRCPNSSSWPRKRDNQWYQAHISGELPDGRVSLRFSGERFDAKLPRADVRLPPPEVKQPNVASPFGTVTPATVSSATTASPQFRTWSDASGAFQIEARLIEHLGESVRLVRKDGKEVVVPLARFRKLIGSTLPPQPKKTIRLSGNRYGVGQVLRYAWGYIV